VLKRLMSCSFTENPVPRLRAPLTTPLGQPTEVIAGVQPVWEHRAPETVSDYRRWSTTDPLAENAGWTEVVIQRGPRVLIDLPVGRSAADLTSLSWWWHATYPGGRPVYSGGDTTTVADTPSGYFVDSQAVAVNTSTCGCPASLTMGGVSCPNNYEVTL
jgi:hypothetical protein